MPKDDSPRRGHDDEPLVFDDAWVAAGTREADMRRYTAVHDGWARGDRTV
ncbi:hypothetical protein [uncultured Jatrophihabitans sp.]